MAQKAVTHITLKHRNRFLSIEHQRFVNVKWSHSKGGFMNGKYLTKHGQGHMLWRDPFKNMDDLLSGFFVQPVALDQALQQSIKIDVHEKPNQYVINAEIPGVSKENIDVSIEGSVISISAETKHSEEKKDENNKLLHRERFYGKMQRVLQLPHDIDEEKADARYENGVLVLILPKRAPDIQKKLAVK